MSKPLRHTFTAILLAAAPLLLCFSESRAQDEFLPPDLPAFLAAVKARLRSDRSLLSDYTFNETQTITRLDKQGGPKKTETKTFEVFPSLDEKLTYRRLISKNGQPTSPKKLSKQDKKQKKKALRHSRGSAKEEALRKREREAIDEVFQILQFHWKGGETIDGHPTVLFEFEPRPGLEPSFRELRFLTRVRGRAWISLTEYELVKLEAELTDSLSFGWGLAARLHRGARLSFRRSKVNEEIWMPLEARVRLSARVLLLKSMRFEAVHRYSNFKKFSVASSIQFDPAGDEEH